MWTLPRIEITDDERTELERRLHASDVPERTVKRARVILAAADGMANRRIASEVGLSEEYVGKWRRRFVSRRLAGLEDRHRSGRPRVYGEDVRLEIVAIATRAEGVPHRQWSHRLLAEDLSHLGISPSQVGRILAEHEVKLHREVAFAAAERPEQA